MPHDQLPDKVRLDIHECAACGRTHKDHPVFKMQQPERGYTHAYRCPQGGVLCMTRVGRLYEG